jgi:hypothetical protein
MRPIRTVVQTLAVALAACLVAAGSAGAEMWTLTPNLVQNPGAELGSSGQGGAVGSIPSWWHGPRPAAVVHYGTPGFPTVAQGAAVGGGSSFFAGGPADGHDDNTLPFAHVKLVQNINLLDERAEDALGVLRDGWAYAIVSACLGGYATQDDRVDVRVSVIGYEQSNVTLHGPSADERDGTTRLLPRTAMLLLPPKADALEVDLDFARASGEFTYNDGYADNVSVLLAKGDGTVPEPSCAFEVPSTPDGSAGSGTPGSNKPIANGGSASQASSTGGTNTAVPLARVGTRVKLHGDVATLKLRCAAHDGPGNGSLALTTRLGRLGSAKFRIAAGKAGTIDVRIGRRMRRRLVALSRTRLAKLEITATARIGAAKTTFIYRAAP